MSPIPILHRDDHLVAVHKPAGLLVHRTTIDARETRFLLQLVRDQIGQPVSPVHRLDKGTSGIVVFALHAEAARRLTAMFGDGGVRKTYLAIVRGWAPASCRIDHPLRDLGDRLARRQVVERRAARSVLRCLARIELPAPVGRYATARYSLVACRPRTGRQHQVRRHLKHLRHPVIGDVNYGDGAHNRFFRDLGVGRLLLAASRLRFIHPFSTAPVSVAAPLEESFAAVLRWPHWQPVALRP
ncbi:MAG: pseudouridine synthase [Deltaproteobacteria bacterium]|nr:pseudouridine synthase [Deltaproteobacteria bacterium]